MKEKEEEGLKLIGTIDFWDKNKVRVYHDQYTTHIIANCVWRMRNPDSCYQGIIYRNIGTGEITYPPDAVIPNQTAEDREMLPMAIITNKKIVDQELETMATTYFIAEHKRRNRDLYGNKVD